MITQRMMMGVVHKSTQNDDIETKWLDDSEINLFFFLFYKFYFENVR